MRSRLLLLLLLLLLCATLCSCNNSDSHTPIPDCPATLPQGDPSPEGLHTLRTCVDSLRSLLGQEHPRTLSAMAALHPMLRASGQSGAAVQVLRVLLPLQARVLGTAHTAHLDSLCALGPSLADSLHQQEDNVHALGQEAIDSARQCVELRGGSQKVEGLAAMNELVQVLFRVASGDSTLPKEEKYRIADEALQVARQCAEGRRTLLGPDNPETLKTEGNLAFLLFANHRRAEGVEVGQQVVERMKRTLPADDANLMGLSNWVKYATEQLQEGTGKEEQEDSSAAPADEEGDDDDEDFEVVVDTEEEDDFEVVPLSSSAPPKDEL